MMAIEPMFPAAGPDGAATFLGCAGGCDVYCEGPSMRRTGLWVAYRAGVNDFARVSHNAGVRYLDDWTNALGISYEEARRRADMILEFTRIFAPDLWEEKQDD